MPLASQHTPDLLSVLRQRKTQAQDISAPYVAPVVARDSMLYWLAEAAQRAREAADRKMVHVAASADMDQSSIWRFEKRNAWPRDPDAIVAAYADDLDVSPIDLWETALQLWREDRARGPEPLNATGGSAENLAGEVQRVEQGLADAPRPQRAAKRKSAPRKNQRA